MPIFDPQIKNQLECIRVVCVVSTAVAVWGWECLLGVVCPGVVSAQRGVCLGGCLPGGGVCLPERVSA